MYKQVFEYGLSVYKINFEQNIGQDNEEKTTENIVTEWKGVLNSSFKVLFKKLKGFLDYYFHF